MQTSIVFSVMSSNPNSSPMPFDWQIIQVNIHDVATISRENDHRDCDQIDSVDSSG